MSADGSWPAPGRNLTYFAWRVSSIPDGRTVASVAGYAGYLSLPTGRYAAALTTYDSGGANTTATKQFVVAASSAAGSSLAPEAGALAAISLPPPAVDAAAGSGVTRVELDATGSAPAPGARTLSVLWAVVSLPARMAVANATGTPVVVWLAPGQYQVSGALESGARFCCRMCRPTQTCTTVVLAVGGAHSTSALQEGARLRCFSTLFPHQTMV
jgi:hypothetical protein